MVTHILQPLCDWLATKNSYNQRNHHSTRNTKFIKFSVADMGIDSILGCHLTSIVNPIVEIRRSYDRLISTMIFPILVRRHLYIEAGHSLLSIAGRLWMVGERSATTAAHKHWGLVGDWLVSGCRLIGDWLKIVWNYSVTIKRGLGVVIVWLRIGWLLVGDFLQDICLVVTINTK